jgi:hypothetical protein
MSFAKLFCCILSFICTTIFHSLFTAERAANPTWLILAGFPLLTILFQSFMLHYKYPYNTVKYLKEKGEMDKAK